MINKAIILGRLARKPDVKEFPDGGILTNMRVITNRSWKDANGERQEKAEGHNVVIRVPAIARLMSESLDKGHIVYIEGSMETRKWTDKDGLARYTTEVVVRPYGGVIRRMPGTGQPSTQPSQTQNPSENEDTPNDEIDAPIDFLTEMDDTFTSDF